MVLRELRVVEHASSNVMRRAVRNPDEPRLLELCSACRGDYEDPDISEADGERSSPEDHDHEEDDGPREEFPA